MGRRSDPAILGEFIESTLTHLRAGDERNAAANLVPCRKRPLTILAYEARAALSRVLHRAGLSGVGGESRPDHQFPPHNSGYRVRLGMTLRPGTKAVSGGVSGGVPPFTFSIREEQTIEAHGPDWALARGRSGILYLYGAPGVSTFSPETVPYTVLYHFGLETEVESQP